MDNVLNHWPKMCSYMYVCVGLYLSHMNVRTIYVTVYGKIGHNAACVDVAKRSI